MALHDLRVDLQLTPGVVDPTQLPVGHSEIVPGFRVRRVHLDDALHHPRRAFVVAGPVADRAETEQAIDLGLDLAIVLRLDAHAVFERRLRRLRLIDLSQAPAVVETGEQVVRVGLEGQSIVLRCLLEVVSTSELFDVEFLGVEKVENDMVIQLHVTPAASVRGGFAGEITLRSKEYQDEMTLIGVIR